MENDDNVFCGTYGEEYGDNSGVIEIWIGCDLCENWYHCSCEGLRKPQSTDIYICNACNH